MTARIDVLTAALRERYPFLSADDAPRAAALLLRELATGVSSGRIPMLVSLNEDGGVDFEGLFASTSDELRVTLQAVGVLP